jgi:4-hydroxybenzoate polyprenyltransferase/phosphoserine phosphatase
MQTGVVIMDSASATSPGATNPGAILAPERPLVVDLDGTLIRTDLLIEAFFTLLAARPLRALAALWGGRAASKAAVAAEVALDVDLLPFNEELLAFLRDEKSRGRRLYLASAADASYVRVIADRLGLFDGIFATEAGHNLKGPAKAKALRDAFGHAGFDYAGNSSVDLAVWKEAGGVIVVNGSPGLIRTVHARFPGARIMTPRAAVGIGYLQAMRPHQWLKNLLLLVPALTSHQFSAGTAIACALAFASFSMCASSVYLLNDLVDLRHDRQHPTKRNRPFASGAVDMLHGSLLFPVVLLIAIEIAMFLPVKFLIVLELYYLLTLAYSIFLKRQPILDVLTLAGLYGIRLFAGAMAIGVELSQWLLTFATFLFLCLALVKRGTELIDRAAKGGADPAGRSYRLSDLAILQSMATSSGYLAVLVFALYISSPAVVAQYTAPERLWAIPAILLYWISRVLILTHRGEMHEDPVLFAARDRPSLICAVLMLAVVGLSI